MINIRKHSWRKLYVEIVRIFFGWVLVLGLPALIQSDSTSGYSYESLRTLLIIAIPMSIVRLVVGFRSARKDQASEEE